MTAGAGGATYLFGPSLVIGELAKGDRVAGCPHLGNAFRERLIPEFLFLRTMLEL